MNERIQQMIYSLNEKVGVHWTNEDKLKFAELIVKEVFAKIDDERFEVYQPVKEAVMKHFGVE